MAYLNLVNFELDYGTVWRQATGHASQGTYVTIAVSYEDSAPICRRFPGAPGFADSYGWGGYNCLRFSPAATGSPAYYEFSRYHATAGNRDAMSVSTLRVGFALYIEQAPGSTQQIVAFVDASNRVLGNLHLNSNRTLYVYSAGKGVASGSIVVPMNEWTYIEFKAGSSSSTAAYEVRVNGATDISGTMGVTYGPNAKVRLGSTNNVAATCELYYDDAYANDAEFATDYGIPYIGLIHPTGGAGTYTMWSGFLSGVQGIPDDGDTSYTYSSFNGNVETYPMTVALEVPDGDIEILAVQLNRIIRSTAPAKGIQMVDMFNGTAYYEVFTVYTTVSSEYEILAFVYNENPYSSGWYKAELENIEVGVYDQEASLHTLRCTQVSGQVLYHMPAQTIVAGEATATASAVSSTVVPGARAIAMGIASIAGDALGLTFVPGGASVEVASATVAAAGVTPAVVPGAVSVTMVSAILEALGQAASTVPGGTAIEVAAALMAATGVSPTVVPGAVSITMDSGMIIISAEAATIPVLDIIIAALAASLTAAGVSCRIQGGTMPAAQGGWIIVPVEDRQAWAGEEDRRLTVEAEDRQAKA